MKKTNPLLSIVIPVYNSENCIEKLVICLKTALKTLTHEIILVNDCSPDNSWNQILIAAKKNKNICGINLRKNSGQDNAIMAGLSYAKGKYIVIMDDDLQHSPSDIPRLLETVEKGYDVCYANFEEKRQAFWKNLGSWFNGKIAEYVIAKPRGIYLSPFKIIRKEVIESILNYNGIYPYVDGLIFQVTGNITQISAKHNKRFTGRGNYNLIRSIRVFLKLLTGFSIQPLRISSYTGFIASVAGFLYGLYRIWSFFFQGEKVAGWTSLIVLILFLGGLILMSLGLIGEYIGRIFLSINRKPSFVIKETVNRQ